MLLKGVSHFLQRRFERLYASTPVVNAIPTTALAAAEWYAKHPDIARFTEVVPSTTGSLPIETKLCHPGFEPEEWHQPTYTIPASFVLELRNARVVGKNGTLVTRDGTIMADISRISDCVTLDHPLLKAESLPPVRLMKGRYLLISTIWVSTYHWLIDVLPRFKLLEMAGYRLSDFDKILLKKPMFPAHEATLAMAGIPVDKIRWLTLNSHFQCEQLVAPSFTNNFRESHAFVYPYLRQLIPPDARRPTPGRRIYISRRDAPFSRREVVNEEELLAIMKAEGVECITMSDYSFEDQVRLFVSAEIIVAPHGGALGNLCFCERPTKVLELFAPSYIKSHTRSTCRLLGFEYHAIVAQNVQNRDPNQKKSLWVDPVLFAAELKAFLALK